MPAERREPSEPSGRSERRRSSRVRDFWSYAVARPLLVLFWAFVAWGTLLLAGLAWSAATKGLTATVAAATPHSQHGIWGWLNLIAPGFALAVWSLWAAAAARTRSTG